MCTVSFISTNNKFIITSNRDEHTSRPTAIEPKEEIINGSKIIYPKDPKAGGTWFAIKENGMIAVLLNGAFQKHIPKDNYSRSRGLLLLDIISNANPFLCISEIALKNIEPFTLILFDAEILIEFRWDGTHKHYKEMDMEENHIWSSSTLYDPPVIRGREALFTKFINGTEKLDEDKIIDFHMESNDDYENGFVINRNNALRTFSVTQAVFEENGISLNHLDLLNKGKHSILMRLGLMTKQLI
ncbi:NRDE family protein [Arenibacter sp. S6351L]|uniref:NRDE family protein n=1 Tax=Arenibacter sp. S6351L TaxID=2926407 RepID=UPI001FF1FA05|nr:NRDE family protein [Arenibacter sp. S6351L]MCK0135929.1 NRDE family protein [Arenibacter sp. S6351L]